MAGDLSGVLEQAFEPVYHAGLATGRQIGVDFIVQGAGELSQLSVGIEEGGQIRRLGARGAGEAAELVGQREAVSLDLVDQGGELRVA